MVNKLITSIIGLSLFSICSLVAQDGKLINGPVISDFGPTFSLERPGFRTDTSQVYKVVFDIHDTPDDPARVNPMLGTLARFLNMHVQAGVPLENLKVAGVFHNKASKDVWDNKAYRELYGMDNPNLPLMKALEEAGAELFMCGQSIYARGIDPDRMAEPVKTALSAMTVFLSLQRQGYTLIRF